MRHLTGATALVLALTLAACATTAGPPTTPSAPTRAAAPTAGTGSSTVSTTTCGVTAEFDQPVERIVSIKSSVTEAVVALGAADRLVGVAALDGPLPAHVTGVDDSAWEVSLPVIAERVPSFEAVAELEPDAVLAGWESNLSADGAGERAMWADLGVPTWVSPSACRDPHLQPEKLSFDDVFAEIRTLGHVLGEDDAAARLVAAQRAALAVTEEATAPLRALWWSSGTDTPFVGAGIGAPQLVMETAGLVNIAADIRDTWTSMSWEEVAARAPDVIVLVDSSWNTAAHKREALAANPVTAALDAVVHERYLVVPFPATESGVRTADAALALRAQLAEVAP